MRTLPLAIAIPAILTSTVQPVRGQSPFEPAPQQVPYFDLLHVEEAWQLTRGSPDCVIGIVDAGFDFFHPALVDNLEPGYFADGLYHTSHYQMLAHGTTTASLIGARNAEENGLVGLAPECTVLAASIGMPVHTLLRMQREFFEQNPGASMTEFQQEMVKRADELQNFGRMWLEYVSRTVSEAIFYLVDHGAGVINMSMLLDGRLFARHADLFDRIETAFTHAAENDVVLVLGAGNNATRVTEYPGDSASVLIVGAATMEDDRWEIQIDTLATSIRQGSSFGPRLSVMAPSTGLYTAVPHDSAFYHVEHSPVGPEEVKYNGRYELQPIGATSLATTFVSSLAGLVRSLRPELTAEEVVRIVCLGAVDLGEDGIDEMTGHGRIDFLETLELARDWPVVSDRPTESEP